MKVLIVDDEPAILELLAFAFSRKSIETETAPSAEAGLALTRNTAFDAALLDKNLPGMSGLELIRRIRETDHKMAIVMMTGFASPETALEALNLDVDAYLEKPFPNLGTVVERITAAVEKRRASPPPPPPPVPVEPPAPSPTAPEVAPAPPAGPPLRVLLVASAELAAKVRAGLSPADQVTLVRKETELFKALESPSDLAIVDAFLLGGEVVPVVERVQRVSGSAEFVILSDRALDLRTVQKLIELNVRRVVQSAAWPRPLRSAVDAARKKLGG